MSGFLEPEDDDDPTNRWLKADLDEHGEIRIRLSKSLGEVMKRVNGTRWLWWLVDLIVSYCFKIKAWLGHAWTQRVQAFP